MKRRKIRSSIVEVSKKVGRCTKEDIEFQIIDLIHQLEISVLYLKEAGNPNVSKMEELIQVIKEKYADLKIDYGINPYTPNFEGKSEYALNCAASSWYRMSALYFETATGVRIGTLVEGLDLTTV